MLTAWGQAGWVRSVGSAVLGGLVLGATNSLVNVVGGPYSSHAISPDGVLPLQAAGAVLEGEAGRHPGGHAIERLRDRTQQARRWEA